MYKYYPKKSVNGKQIKTARLIMSRFLKRDLTSNELVHHINGNVLDNRIENLEIVSRSEHKKLHPEIGEKTRFKKIYSINPDEILELFKKLTINEIAKKYNCSYQVIWQSIKDNDLRNKIKCSICGKFAKYRRKQLCAEHYYRQWRTSKILLEK